MRRLRFTTLSVLSLVLCGMSLFFGCHHQGTTRQRAHSMAALRQEGFDTDHLEAFIVARTGMLVVGDRFVRLGGDDGSSFRSIMLGKVSLGMATIITSDGYALTAAHCVDDDGRVIVAYVQRQGPDGRRALVAEARKVWVGKPASFGGDLALLKIDAPADLHCFAWAMDSEITPGSRVLLAGQQTVREGNPLTLAAGRLLERPSSRLPHRKGNLNLIPFDAPGRPGDSGGALMNPGGTLVGIVVGYNAPLFGHGHAMAVRPDTVWLEELIRQDRLRCSQAVNSHRPATVSVR